jgi:hypothetical protein
MKKYLLPTLLAFITIGAFSAHAQSGAIVTCNGSATSPCTWGILFTVFRKLISLGLGLAIMYGFIRIAYIGAKYGLRSDEPSVRSEFRNNAIVILLSTIALAVLLPAMSYAIKELKADPSVLKPINCLQDANSKDCPDSKPTPDLKASFNSIEFFPHAYAQTQNILPQTVKVNGSIYDYFFTVFQLVIRILFIALILLWLYAGFMMVAARGNGPELEKAKNRLWYSVFLTVILLLVQVLLVSLKGTITN